MKRFVPFLLLFAGLFQAVASLPAAASLGLIDSDESRADFEARFLASYGVHSAIEPDIGPAERTLYERIVPFLREDPERAIREVEAAPVSESSPAVQFLLGNLYYRTGELGRAEAHLLRAIDGFPDFRRAHRTLGLIFTRSERYDEAIAAWLKVVTLGGGDAQSYGLLGHAYLNARKYAGALAAYRMARMFKPDSRDFRLGEAQCLLETDRPREAVALLEELLAENPDEVRYWLLQANGWILSERDDEAIVNLEIAHALGGGTPDSRFLLGNLHLRREHFRLALEQYREAVNLAGGVDSEKALSPIRHLIARGSIAEAEDYLAFLENAPGGDRSLGRAEDLALARARIDHASGRTEEARELLTAFARKHPLDADALLFLAELWREAGDFARAEFYFGRVLALPDRKADALVGLGRLEVERGDLESALEYLRTASRIEPRAGLTRYIESIEAAL